ncbi:MAG: DUF1353 domain-containing protein [Burkholderiales bacterium]|nr:DUF1353 domain-containing protein [Burkholderiales bacterium]
MPFSSPVRTEWLADGRRMMVMQAITYTDPAGRVWEVPTGFVTDGASIPQELWSLLGSPFTGLYRIAAVFHDAAYSNPTVSRDDADNMLRAACLELGCSEWLADTLYAGVRIGGEVSYVGDQRNVSAAVPVQVNAPG